MPDEISRRKFIQLCGVLSLAATAPAGLIPLAEAAAGPGRSVQTRLKMGTIVTLTAAGVTEAQAEEAFAAAFAEVDRLTAVFDRHHPGAAVFELNAAGTLSDPGPEMLEVMNRARRVWEMSHGAFDPTVLPLVTAMEESFSAASRPPAEAAVAEALRLVDFGAVRFGRSGIRLGAGRQKMSLDGVAKGYIVDRAVAALKAHGVKNALINAGGDIVALGVSHRGGPWRVAIQDPFNSRRYLKVVGLSNRAIATSGSYENYYDQKQEYHHLVNPASGRPAGRLASATILAPDAALADAASTAVFVQPDTLRSAGLDAMIVGRRGGQNMTEGFKKLAS